MLEPSTVLQPSRPLLWHPQGGFVGGKKAKRAQPASLEGLCVLEAFCGDNCVFPTSMVRLAWVPVGSPLGPGCLGKLAASYGSSPRMYLDAY